MRRIPKKAIFISRLAPDTASDELNIHIKSNLKIINAECTRLKTKFSSYSSFHISIDEPDFLKIMNCKA